MSDDKDASTKPSIMRAEGGSGQRLMLALTRGRRIMSQPEGESMTRFLWCSTIVTILIIGVLMGLFIDPEYLQWSGGIVAVITGIWFAGRSQRANEKFQESKEDKKQWKFEADGWSKLTAVSGILGLIFAGFGSRIIDGIHKIYSIVASIL